MSYSLFLLPLFNKYMNVWYKCFFLCFYPARVCASRGLCDRDWGGVHIYRYVYGQNNLNCTLAIDSRDLHSQTFAVRLLVKFID